MKKKEIVNSEEKKTHVLHFLNFLEEVATSVEYEIADSDVIQEFYGEIMSAAWKSLSLWIEDFRKTQGLNNAWVVFERLYKTWSV